jgi:D-erythro-7,8-dihydroneopterin triphosphate epimerase
MATVRITNLKLRTIIGANDWERNTKQDVTINITFDYDASKAIKTDKLDDAADYKIITKKIIKAVENSDFQLIEKMAAMVLDIVLEDKKIKEATVRIDKPQALRFADSVSVELYKKQS